MKKMLSLPYTALYLFAPFRAHKGLGTRTTNKSCKAMYAHYDEYGRVKTSNFGQTCKIGHFSTSPDITPCSRLLTN